MKKVVNMIERAKNRIASPAKIKAVKVATPSPSPATKIANNITTSISKDILHRMIATRAYFLAELRNFEPGFETNDWLTAEAEIKK
ncbi:MAG: DUF2934 domain-containing protein [Methylophilus sp.]